MLNSVEFKGKRSPLPTVNSSTIIHSAREEMNTDLAMCDVPQSPSKRKFNFNQNPAQKLAVRLGRGRNLDSLATKPTIKLEDQYRNNGYIEKQRLDYSNHFD